MVKTMTPVDCAEYCDLHPQFIREALKTNRVDFGFAINPTGKRWRYAIIPSKFFAYIGKDVPKEWMDTNNKEKEGDE